MEETARKKLIFSGIQPTGTFTLGNYIGAIRNWGPLQDEYNCIYCVVDMHAITVRQEPAKLRQNTLQAYALLMACGIDLDKSILFIQSHVKTHAELNWILGCSTQFGELSRMTQFKDKSARHADDVNSGLFTYPVLMAADILVHKADKVPVGKDQEQNMEMARLFARRFNRIYNIEYFKEPESFHFNAKAVKVPGLDGSGKMGKSEGNAIYLCDDEATIKKKVMRAVTDAGPTMLNQEKPEPIENLFTLMQLVSTPDTYDYFNDQYNNMAIRYGDMKKQLAADINAFCAPIRERILDFQSNEDYLAKVAREGAEAASASAEKTIREVREIIGFRK